MCPPSPQQSATMDASVASLVSSSDSSLLSETGADIDAQLPAADVPEKPLPRDLSHLISQTTNLRLPSRMKQYYKFFQIPGSSNLAGGLPHVSFFPYDTLEAQIATPDRWRPSPQTTGLADSASTDDEDDDAVLITAKLAAAKIVTPASSATATQSDRVTPARLQVPKSAPAGGSAPTPDKKIDLATALQYGGSDGYPPLLSWVRELTREHLHPNVPYRGGPEVIMTVGATDGLNKTYELFVDNWNPKRDNIRDRPGLLVEPFIYGNALSQALPRGVQVIPVNADDGGMMAQGPGGLEDVLTNWDYGRGRRPHLLYNVTLGHNPTGIVLSTDRRKELYDVCSRFDVIIIEDDPYWHLQYPSAAEAEAVSRHLPRPPKTASTSLPEGHRSSGYEFLDSLVPSFLSIDVDGRVIRLDTFSKTVAPGCRVGWITAQPDLIERFVRITEGTTSQPSGFVQSLLSELVRGPLPLPNAKKRRASAAVSALTADSGSSANFSGWQTDGWVRWLEGLRGEYERRMTLTCTILDDGAYQLKQGTPVRAADSDWGVITKTQLYSFSWPRAGMFIWLRMHFEAHPLWQAPRSDSHAGTIDGPALQMALLLLLVSKPYQVVISPGTMFSATEDIVASRGWAYYRLCFAAESDDRLTSATHRVVAGIQKFWKIKKVKDIEDLLAGSPFSVDETAALTNLGSWMAC